MRCEIAKTAVEIWQPRGDSIILDSSIRKEVEPILGIKPVR
jgi:hypothetical protein